MTSEPRKRSALLTAAILITLVVHPASPAMAGEEQRRPPYDFGCIGVRIGSPSAPPCAPRTGSGDFEPARQGIVTSGTFPAVSGLTYTLPPFPMLSTGAAGTTTGIDIEVAELSYLSVSATLRRTRPVDVPPALANHACIAVSGSTAADGRSCEPVTAEKFVVTSDFEGRAFGPGRQRVFVYLAGCSDCVTDPSEALVEKISYTVTPIRGLSVTVRGPGFGLVRSADRKLACGPSPGLCFLDYAQGTRVKLIAIPKRGSRFDGWKGCDAPVGTRCRLTIGAGQEKVTATFAKGASASSSNPFSRSSG